MSHSRLRALELPARLLVTWFLVTLGVGFVAAQVNLRLHHEFADGRPGLGLSDVEAAFHGRRDVSLLTSKVSPGGSMAKHLPSPKDHETLRSWVEQGAPEPGFPVVREVLDRRCIRCHNPAGKMKYVPFAHSREQGADYSLVKPFTAPSTGMSWASLARSSHAHLFGMGTLFALAGGIFLLTGASFRIKGLLVSLPYVAMFIDIGSWWLTKLARPFAIGIIAGGGLMALALAALIAWPLWEMWRPRRGGSP